MALLTSRNEVYSSRGMMRRSERRSRTRISLATLLDPLGLIGCHPSTQSPLFVSGKLTEPQIRIRSSFPHSLLPSIDLPSRVSLDRPLDFEYRLISTATLPPPYAAPLEGKEREERISVWELYDCLECLTRDRTPRPRRKCLGVRRS